MASLFVLVFVALFGLPVGNACRETDDTCEFWLAIKFTIPMLKDRVALYPKDGKLYEYDTTNTSSATPVSPEGVLTADGHESTRAVVTANGTMPGPPIEVWDGQNVIIHVKNDLFSDGVTIHWHGLHQKGTPHMDGVAYVTQCPIMPQQTFTYKFKAEPSGTFWYHSHIGFQRTEGLLGAFIIREKNKTPDNEKLVVLQDWNHDYDADMVQLKMIYGNFENRKKIDGTASQDGGRFSLFTFQSGLINGRGRYYSDSSNHNEAPLHVFDVQKGTQYRFRVISAGLLYPYRLSVHGHKLRVVASDGYELEPVDVDSIIINPGERFDFILDTNADVGNYWMFSETLEAGLFHVAEAIVRYEGAGNDDPTTAHRQCTANDRCKVLNCPFLYYPVGHYTDCITFNELRAKDNDPAPTWVTGQSKEMFLNFAFPGIKHFPSSVNGRGFIPPPVAAITQPREITPRCEDASCGDEKNCLCAASYEIGNDDVVQMVLLNMGNGKGWGHPIHLHGHSFYVLKMGYARYNESTGRLLGDNLDIDCRGNPDREKSFCNSATWSDADWLDGKAEGLELEKPPRKDTLIVPTGGYAVVRIRANNPGVWFMHCHIQLHSGDGMAVMINESFSEIPAAPEGFPVCGDFPREHITDNGGGNNERQDGRDGDGAWLNKRDSWVVFGVLIGIIVLLIIMNIVTICVLRRSK